MDNENAVKYTMGYYSTVKKNEIMKLACECIELLRPRNTNVTFSLIGGF